MAKLQEWASKLERWAAKLVGLVAKIKDWMVSWRGMGG